LPQHEWKGLHAEKNAKKQILSGQTPKQNNINPMNYDVLNIVGVGTNQ